MRTHTGHSLGAGLPGWPVGGGRAERRQELAHLSHEAARGHRRSAWVCALRAAWKVW